MASFLHPCEWISWIQYLRQLHCTKFTRKYDFYSSSVMVSRLQQVIHLVVVRQGANRQGCKAYTPILMHMHEMPPPPPGTGWGLVHHPPNFSTPRVYNIITYAWLFNMAEKVLLHVWLRCNRKSRVGMSDGFVTVIIIVNIYFNIIIWQSLRIWMF